MQRTTLMMILTLCFSCSINDNLYLTRGYTPDKKIGNFIVSIDGDKAEVFILRREESQVVKEEYELLQQSDRQYADSNMILTIDRNGSTIKWDENLYTLNEVKRKNNRQTTLPKIEHLIENNYIVWANQHQITDHDLRSDSICYIFSRPDKEPYDTINWFLLTVADEYFLTFNNISNSIPRVELKKGTMYMTQCGGNECIEYEAKLKAK
ncbi:MAG: hypothetical protein AAGJ93_17845, partial [Bacteroidota bacterium]